jgi:hypothetical protein
MYRCMCVQVHMFLGGLVRRPPVPRCFSPATPTRNIETHHCIWLLDHLVVGGVARGRAWSIYDLGCGSRVVGALEGGGRGWPLLILDHR